MTELWYLERIDYDKQEFIPCGQLRITESQVEAWCQEHNKCAGFTKALVEEFKKIHYWLKNETIIVAEKDYIGKEVKR